MNAFFDQLKSLSGTLDALNARIISTDISPELKSIKEHLEKFEIQTSQIGDVLLYRRSELDKALISVITELSNISALTPAVGVLKNMVSERSVSKSSTIHKKTNNL